MSDLTWCVSADCPFDLDCERHVRNCIESGLVSMADLSGVCRRYIGWVLMELESGGEIDKHL